MTATLKIHKTSRPPLIHNPVVLITGDGWSLPADLKNFETFHVKHDVYCIGRSIQHDLVTVVDHWGDIDSDVAVWVAEHLPDKGKNGAILRHTLGDCRGFDVDWDVEGASWNMDDTLWHGSTSLFAVLTSLTMGYHRIVLAGCPLDSKGHWHTPGHDGPPWTRETYQAWFEFADTPDGVNKVRSLSGYTKTMLGYPNEEFLNESSPS